MGEGYAYMLRNLPSTWKHFDYIATSVAFSTDFHHSTCNRKQVASYKLRSILSYHEFSDNWKHLFLVAFK